MAIAVLTRTLRRRFIRIAELSMPDVRRAKRGLILALGNPESNMACSRCGTDCNCACSGDPLSSQDWRRQVSLQVRAHRVRKRRRLDPDAPLLEFDEPEPLAVEEEVQIRPRRSSNWQRDQDVLAPRSQSVQTEAELARQSSDMVITVEQSTVART